MPKNRRSTALQWLPCRQLARTRVRGPWALCRPVRVAWVLCRLDTPIRRLLEVGLGVAGQVRGRKRARMRGGPLEIHGMRVGRQRGGKAREPIHATVKQGVRDKGRVVDTWRCVRGTKVRMRTPRARAIRCDQDEGCTKCERRDEDETLTLGHSVKGHAQSAPQSPRISGIVAVMYRSFDRAAR